MSGIMGKIMAMMKKLSYLGMQYAYILLHWKLRFFKIQLQKWKKCTAQKKMEETYSGLGAEAYALYKQGETDWQSMPSVQQQLKQAEEAESKVLQIEAAIDQIDSAYQAKKEDIKEKYAAKRAEVGAGDSSSTDTEV